MVLAIGIVVDDAIVVVENVERVMRDENLPAPEATRKAMGQITPAIIAITLVLLSVFIPVGFIPGITGSLYAQFALTVSVAMLPESAVYRRCVSLSALTNFSSRAISASRTACDSVLRSASSGKYGLLGSPGAGAVPLSSAILPSTRETPTSSRAAPGLTMSAVSTLRLPTAATTMSACPMSS